MFTGNPPYHTQNAMSTMYSIVEDEHPPLPSNLSDELRSFLLLCFRKEPRARPTTLELLQHLWIVQYRTISELSIDQQSSLDHPSMGEVEAITTATMPDPLDENGDLNDTMLEARKDVKSRSRPPTQVLLRTNVKTLNHFAVATFFCQAVACRICGDPVKRAMYCHHCRVVAHADCLATSRMACLRDPNAPQSIILSSLQKTGATPKHDGSGFAVPGIKSMLNSTKDYAADVRHRFRPVREFEAKSHRVNARDHGPGACRIS